LLGNGNVGIGKTNPGSKLDVNGNVNVNGDITMSANRTLKMHAGTSGTNTFVFSGTDGYNRVNEYFKMIGETENYSNPVVSFWCSNTIASGPGRIITIRQGNVGIGTGQSAPGDKLSVDGRGWALNGWASGSDRRLKTNIVSLGSSLPTVMKMNPVAYNKKVDMADNEFKGEEMGFIAQELQPLFPKGVVIEGKDPDKLLAVNYNSLIPVLTKAIQEQQQQIEAGQKAKLEQQKEIDELKAKLEAQQKQIDSILKAMKK